MHICVICHFSVELDDVELRGPDDRCICLTCYRRESASERPMPKALRRDLTEILGLLESAA